ncbi:MAG: SCP2 sterol-binding domain-containing protein [Gammaproteobacteria bacterium]|nr:SCP2 sterol-binding domain-containing protein [Gammaproteobacteria bacterium]
MSERTAIPELARQLLRGPAQQLLDRGVENSTTAAALCKRLDGKVLQIDPGTAPLAVFFAVSDARLSMQSGYAPERDATITGSPLQLARLSGPDPQGVIREGAVMVSGDAEVAEQFQYLLELVRPDPEEELSRFTGDAVAHEAGRLIRGLTDWAGGAGRSVGRSLSEYLSEESRVLVTRAEADEFCADVDALAAGVDRLEARLRILRDNSAQE